MRVRRPWGVHGAGCLGCLPFGGLLTGLFPLIAVGALIYWLVTRRRTTADSGAPQRAATFFCSHCGKPISPGDKFCPACGHSATGS